MIQSVAFSYSYQTSSTPLSFPSIEIEFGQRVALIGPSGSGKTTLLHLLAGILATQNSIEVHTAQLANMNDAERRKFRVQNIGLVFQDFQLLEYLNVTDNILLPFQFGDFRLTTNRNSGRGLESRPRVVLKRRLQELSNALNIEHKLRNRVTELSHGERQRVSMCRALMTKPTLILADEPTGSLDPQTAELTIQQLFENSGSDQATLIVATHDYTRLDQFDQIIDLGVVSPQATSNGEVS